jgi:hypothetical protein
MNTISISVSGTDLETINITLTDAEVKAIYEANKEYKTKVEKIEKELSTAEMMRKHYSDNADKSQKELNDMHALMTALGVTATYQDTYNDNKYPLATRMALFLANRNSVGT